MNPVMNILWISVFAAWLQSPNPSGVSSARNLSLWLRCRSTRSAEGRLKGYYRKSQVAG